MIATINAIVVWFAFWASLALGAYALGLWAVKRLRRTQE